MIAWQTWLVVVLAAANFAIAQVLANTDQLGPLPAWLTLVVLPTLAMLITLATNQLKAIGAERPPQYPQAKPNP